MGFGYNVETRKHKRKIHSIRCKIRQNKKLQKKIASDILNLEENINNCKEKEIRDFLGLQLIPLRERKKRLEMSNFNMQHDEVIEVKNFRLNKSWIKNKGEIK